jgi:hypothetical protein
MLIQKEKIKSNQIIDNYKFIYIILYIILYKSVFEM